MDTRWFVVLLFVVIFAVLWRIGHLFDIPRCVHTESIDRVRVMNVEPYLDAKCDAQEIRVWLKEHDFEHATDDFPDKIYVR